LSCLPACVLACQNGFSGARTTTNGNAPLVLERIKDVELLGRQLMDYLIVICSYQGQWRMQLEGTSKKVL